MRIFLSDTFYDAILGLPKEIQKKVISFQKKFREDPSTNGIHLEPIREFADDTMRTARIDDKYRIVLGLLGNESYHLLYVGNHEDAYDWGKRKRFFWNDHTQSAQLVTIQESEEPLYREETPASQEVSDLFKGVTKEQVIKIGVPEELIDKVMQIRSLDDLDAMEAELPTDAFENIFYYLDGEKIENLIAEIEEGQAKEDEDKLLSNNNKRNFMELTDDDALQRIIDQDLDKWQLFLHPSQRKLVDAEYKGAIKVSGGAGTGKTVAALHRLKYLCQKSGAKVLFTTFTRALRDNLEGLIKKMDVPSNRYTINNIDQVLIDCAKKCHIREGYKILDYAGGNEQSLKLWQELLTSEITEFDERFLYDEYIEVIVYFGITDRAQYLTQQRVGRSKSISRKQRCEIWALVEKYIQKKQELKVVDRLELFNETTKYLNDNNERPYTNVIADEFQDFSNPELRFLRALVAEGNNDLFLTGDPFQRIYLGRKINFTSVGINVRGVRSKRLKVNYRTTEPIKKVAMSIVQGIPYEDMDGGTESIKGYISLIRGGIEPIYEMADNVTDEVDKVIKWINECTEDGIKLSDICVVVPSLKNKDIRKRLHADKIHFKEVTGATKVGVTNGLSICTYHSIKGLEFKVVILTEVNERNFPSVATDIYPFMGKDEVQKKDYLYETRSLLYVAITRARQLVYIVGFGERTGLIKSKYQ